MCCRDGAEAPHSACPCLGRTCPHPGNAKASSSSSVKKQEPLRMERRSAGHSHSVALKGEGNGKKAELLCFYSPRMRGTQDCQLFASP